MQGCHVQPEQMFNLIWGYNGHFVYYWSIVKDGDGNYEMTFPGPGSDEVWVLEAASYINLSRVQRVMLEVRNSAGTLVFLKDGDTVSITIRTTWNGRATIPPSGDVTMVFVSCLNGDGIRGRIWGYKMKLVQ